MRIFDRLTDGQSPTEFLAAYAVHKNVSTDPARAGALVLAGVYKNVYKGGIGKWVDCARHLDDQTWLEKVATSWSYDPRLQHGRHDGLQDVLQGQAQLLELRVDVIPEAE